MRDWPRCDAPHRGRGKPAFAVGPVFDPTGHTLRDTAWKQLCRYTYAFVL